MPKPSGLLPSRASRPPVGAMVVVGVAADDARETLLGREVAVGGYGAEVVAAARERHAHAALAREGHRFAQRAHADHGTHAVAAVDGRDGGRDTLDANACAGVDAAELEALAVGFDTAHAMGVVPEEVSQHQDARRVGGILRREAERDEGAPGEPRQLFLGHCAVIFASRTTLPHLAVSESM